MNVYFTDYFGIDPAILEAYGAFNVSLINDLPVFIDPFLLFNSDKAEYQSLHNRIIEYIRFLREMSEGGAISRGLLRHWFLFPEVKQNWMGYSRTGNRGAGLGQQFAAAMNANLATIFHDFGSEQITKGSHLEKLCLIRDGVGRDNISDFTTNLIKNYLAEYTQTFATTHLGNDAVRTVEVSHAHFDYKLRRWISGRYRLPYIDGDFVLLTPKDILTKDDAWINKHDIIADFDGVLSAIPNDELRGQINDYLLRQIPDDATRRETNIAIAQTLRHYPQLVDYYIRYKEEHGDDAVSLSKAKVKETEQIFIRQVSNLISQLNADGRFYREPWNTLDETHVRVLYLKQVIENNDGYRIFYVKGAPIKREADLQLMFRLTWFASDADVNAEVNNGRGPVDYKISRGSADSTLVEFKLASNSKLRQNLEHQVEIYEAANRTKDSIKVILFFTDDELIRLTAVLRDLGLSEGRNLVLIDARQTNKPSGSRAR